tara:strand:+ start:1641 stop:3704 length:2064 start_codon:yes stop_codon:yes gene_type:complete
MGRKPRQEPLKTYLENPRTTWLFSSPQDYTEVFPQGDKATSEMYLKPATKGTRLGKGTYRIVLHLPNKHHNDRAEYMETLENGRYGRYLEGGPLQASRIRFDSGSYPSAELVLHTQKGKRVNFFLTPANHEKGGVVYAQASFPSPKSRKLVQCPVQVGYFGVSASRPGEFKLTLQKPRIECGKQLVAAGHAPEEFLKPEKKAKKGKKEAKVAQAENENYYMTEEDHKCFYEAQGIDMNELLEIQDVEIMDSETEQQAIERAYYNPSEAMVGTDETLDGYRPIDSALVDLTSNQPNQAYGAENGKKHMMCADCGSHNVKRAGHGYHGAEEGETATYSPSNEPDMVSSSDFENPTNANFSAEGEAIADVEESVEPASEPVAVAEGTSLDGYAPIDSLEEGAPIGHGVNQYFGSAEGVEDALLDESTTGITIEEGVSLDGYSGVDSVVVEAPLGHGVTQWYAEESKFDELSDEIAEQYEEKGMSPEKADEVGDATAAKIGFAKYGKKGMARRAKKGRMDADSVGSPEPQFDEDITGQDGPSADPTNANFSADGRVHDYKGYDTKMDESLGVRDGKESTKEQSMKDRRDEASAMDKMHSKMGRKYDDVMTMDAESKAIFGKDKKGRMYARNRKTGEIITHDADGITGDKPFVPAVKTGAGFVVGMALPSLLIGTAAFLSMMLFGNGNNGSE